MHIAARNLLVVLAAFSTLLAGVRGGQNVSRPTGSSIAALGSEALDGSREDDSGKRSEETEEDDREKNGDRDIHLLATTALACSLEASGVFFNAGASAAKPRLHRRAFPIRGPPAAC
jgi:hypothetical protein